MISTVFKFTLKQFLSFSPTLSLSHFSLSSVSPSFSCHSLYLSFSFFPHTLSYQWANLISTQHATNYKKYQNALDDVHIKSSDRRTVIKIRRRQIFRIPIKRKMKFINPCLCETFRYEKLRVLPNPRFSWYHVTVSLGHVQKQKILSPISSADSSKIQFYFQLPAHEPDRKSLMWKPRMCVVALWNPLTWAVASAQ